MMGDFCPYRYAGGGSRGSTYWKAKPSKRSMSKSGFQKFFEKFRADPRRLATASFGLLLHVFCLGSSLARRQPSMGHIRHSASVFGIPTLGCTRTVELC